MDSRHFVAWAIAGAAITGPAPVFGQDAYPIKVVRIVTSAVGGGSDILARLIAPGLGNALGQQVIVDNRGALSAEIVAKAPPDGYTLLVNGSPLWILPLIRPSSPWDAVRDYAPISLAVNAPGILVVHPSLPVKSTKELIALARARPGELNYAAGTLGAGPHLAAELFKSMTGVKMVQVPYKGTGPGIVGLISGQVELMFPNAGSVMPHVKAGRLRALAVCSAEPSPLAPGLPTLASTVPGYESISPQGVLAPARTPPAIVNRLNQEIVRILNQPDMKEKIFNMSMQVIANSPAEFSAKIKADIARLDKVIRSAGIREEK